MTTLCGPIATAHPPATSGSVTVPSVLRATLQTIRRANESLWQQQDDSQMAETARRAADAASPAAHWMAQTFERERQAQELSADILRRDQEYRQDMRHRRGASPE